MAEKVDRRVRKTKMQLRHGLARLMQKKSIKEITVKELVDEVDITRFTFYLHYTDICQMLEKIEEEAMVDIRKPWKDVLTTLPKEIRSNHFWPGFFLFWTATGIFLLLFSGSQRGIWLL